MNRTGRSGRSTVKKKGLKGKGSRASSRNSSRSSNGGNLEKPDNEAEEIYPKKKASARFHQSNKEELFKPLAEEGIKKKKKKPKKAVEDDLAHFTAADDDIKPAKGKRMETKGFDTLINEEINEGKNVGGELVKQI